MLHQFFADDSGVMIRAEARYFEEPSDAIRLYEKISGAKFNVGKSTIIPIGLDNIPDWLRATGCKVARKGEIIKYLGFPIGWGVSEEEQKDFILGKIQKKMNNWKLRLLSFAGKVVTLKHMLRSVPIHLLPCLRLHRQALEAMEGMCRTFLWGKNVNGGNKIPLVAWSEITKGKSKGGLHLTAFQTSSKVLRLKMSMKLIQDTEEEWVLTAEQVIKSVRWRGARAADRDSWNRQEILLLGGPKRIPHAPTVTGIASPEDDLVFRIGLSANTGDRDVIPIHDLEWYWKPKIKHFKGWIHTSAVWKLIASPVEMEDETLNLKWNRTDTPRQWKKRWRRLWRSQIQSKDKIWVWKLIRQGIPSLQRAMKWSNGNGLCMRCGETEENVSHIFTECWKAREKWTQLAEKVRRRNWTPTTGSTFIDLLDSIWRGNDVARVNLYVKMLWTIWLERNTKTYNSQELTIPTQMTARMAKNFIEAVKAATKEETEAYQKLLKACEELEEVFPEMVAPRDQTETIEDTINPGTQTPMPQNTIPLLESMTTIENGAQERNDEEREWNHNQLT
ncbi:hypothetical protein R1sor_012058 [Riccia sorocarpa]|uniref:Reverse transcriptase zinc-binding domain-containing protein n=1 Tax=Riccia sorocarpa TaxID=122646 RepID=A0ABD3I2P6_9MARC